MCSYITFSFIFGVFCSMTFVQSLQNSVQASQSSSSVSASSFPNSKVYTSTAKSDFPSNSAISKLAEYRHKRQLPVNRPPRIEEPTGQFSNDKGYGPHRFGDDKSYRPDRFGDDQSYGPQQAADYKPEPPPTDALTEKFANDIVRLLYNSKILKDFVRFRLPRPFWVVYNIGHEILLRDAIMDPELAYIAAAATEKQGVLRSSVWFYSMSHMLAKFYSNKGLLRKDNELRLAKQLVRFVERFTKRNGVFDTESLMRDVCNGFYDFLLYKKLINMENLAELFILFSKFVASKG